LEVLESRTLLSVFTVDRLTDLGQGAGQAGDLRYCLTNAVTDDTITFGVTGTINLTGALPELTQSINIVGPGADLVTVRRDTGGRYRIFEVAAGTLVNIYGLTIAHGADLLSQPGGAGIYNQGTLTVAYATITENSATSSGGAGIYNQGRMTVIHSTISANRLFTGGGTGIRNEGTLTLASSTVSGDSAGEYNVTSGVVGGGIYNRGTLRVTNSTIANNQLVGRDLAEGGGIYNEGPLTVTNSTVAGNSTYASPGSQSRGGGIYTLPSIVVHNTIVATNYNFPFPDGPDLYGTLGSSGYNLIGDSSGGLGFDETDLLNVNPLLEPLSNNGGPTQTMGLSPGSPAIDSGDNTAAPKWDERGPGFPRIVNGIIDIGAFEVQEAGESSGRSELSFQVGTLATASSSPSRPAVVPAPVAGMRPVPSEAMSKPTTAPAQVERVNHFWVAKGIGPEAAWWEWDGAVRGEWTAAEQA
jgi:hypothetical protein